MMNSNVPNTFAYPIMLNLTGKPCVVVGGGRVGARKVKGLLNTGASVTVISPKLVQSLESLAEQKQIVWQSTEYSSNLLDDIQPLLVFAATDSAEVNQQVAADARQLGALVNIVDGTGDSDFSNMSTVHRKPIAIGISTNGASPALSAYLKQRIEELIGDEYVILAQWLSDLRPELQSFVHNQTDRSHLYEAIIASDILTLLRMNETDAAYQRFQDILLAGQVAS